MNRNWLSGTALFIAAAAVLFADVCRADDPPPPIKTPQAAGILLTNGRSSQGTLVEITDKVVRFQLAKGSPLSYKLADIKAIQTADGIYVYNADKAVFEIHAAAAIKDPPAKDPTDKAEDEKQIVIAEGVGTDAEEALKDAFRAAIRQVVGTLVDAETLVKNDQVISDKVLTYSDGIIKGGYKELSRKEEKGLVRIKISASVERRSVATKLKEANVTVKEVEGKDLAAEILTQKDARERGTELLQAALADLPKVLVAEAGRPNAKDYDDTTGTLNVSVAVGVDAVKYVAFRKKLVGLLDKVSKAKDTAITDLNSSFPFVPIDDKKEWILWVSTGTDPQLARGRWSIYVMDCDVANCFAGVEGEFKVEVSLLDKDGEVITAEQFTSRLGGEVYTGPIDFSHEGWLTLHSRSIDENFKAQQVVIICPLNNFSRRILQPAKGPRRILQPAEVDKLDIKLTVADLARLKEMKCKIILPPSKHDE